MKNDARFAVFLIFIVLQGSIGRSQSLSGTVNSYYAITAVNSTNNTVTVDNASGLSVGQRVFLYQAKGAAITATNSAAYGDIATLNNAGGYEFNTICSINGNVVWLLNAMVNAYDPTAMSQLVTVPYSSSITVSGTITAQPWDSLAGKGGIVVLESTGTITLNADIDVRGQGFEGATLINFAIPPYNCSWAVTVNQYFLSYPANGFNTGGRKGEGVAPYIVNEEYGRGKLANGGGGGDNGNSGGGGGGNYGAGGVGGQRAGETTFDCHAQYPGVGGASLSPFGYTTTANRVFFGGGGGSGEENNAAGEPGGNGGGIIVLSAQTIVGGGGQLLASGLQPTNSANNDPLQAAGDGGGGGGAGGTIILNATTVTGTINADVSGAAGSNSSYQVNDCTGPGGGGGGGTIWAAGPVFPAAVSATLNGGAYGIVSTGNTKPACSGSNNGAAAGNPGISLTGYTTPLSTGPVCTILAVSALNYFNATRAEQDILLVWALTDPQTTGGIRNFVLQRSSDLSHFTTLATLSCSTDSISYHYTDNAGNTDGVLAYRLEWQNATGEWSYSRIVIVSGRPGPDGNSIRLYPDPASNYLTLTVVSTTAGPATISVSSALGQSLFSRQISLFKGLNTVSIPLGTLAPAAYFLVLQSEDSRLVKPFLKKE
jgi:hypothetical protein